MKEKSRKKKEKKRNRRNIKAGPTCLHKPPRGDKAIGMDIPFDDKPNSQSTASKSPETRG
jgi:hypothetical protein